MTGKKILLLVAACLLLGHVFYARLSAPVSLSGPVAQRDIAIDLILLIVVILALNRYRRNVSVGFARLNPREGGSLEKLLAIFLVGLASIAISVGIIGSYGAELRADPGSY